ncbi:MAG: Hpt domain-containing protein [Oscillospiraceae bacterium]
MNRYELFKAGIDVTEGMKRFNNEKETYGAFLLKFMEDEYYSELCSALAEGDVVKAFNSAHSLKGVAGNLSLTDLHAPPCGGAAPWQP